MQPLELGNILMMRCLVTSSLNTAPSSLLPRVARHYTEPVLLPELNLQLVVKFLGFQFVGSPSAFLYDLAAVVELDPINGGIFSFVERHVVTSSCAPCITRGEYCERKKLIRSISRKSQMRPDLQAGTSPSLALRCKVTGCRCSSFAASSSVRVINACWLAISPSEL